MVLELTRYGSIPNIGVYGELQIGSFKCFTTEREWLDNEPFISCIPPGLYALVKHDSPKYGNTWAIVNEKLGIYQLNQGDGTRYACLIHAANFPGQVQGCIAPGRKIMHINGKLGVSASAITFKKILKLLDTEDSHTLNIRWADYEFR